MRKDLRPTGKHVPGTKRKEEQAEERAVRRKSDNCGQGLSTRAVVSSLDFCYVQCEWR